MITTVILIVLVIFIAFLIYGAVKTDDTASKKPDTEDPWAGLGIESGKTDNEGAVNKFVKESGPLKLTVTMKLDTDMEFYCKIAGVQHHCTGADVGGFLGYVAPEENNPYDKNACAVYRNDGKLVGYIPKDELTEYRQWSGCKPLNCIGFIKTGTEVPLFGKVKVMNNADKDEMEIIVIKYVRWLVANFGKKYIPADFNISTDEPPKTKSDWLAVLDEYIENNDN